MKYFLIAYFIGIIINASALALVWKDFDDDTEEGRRYDLLVRVCLICAVLLSFLMWGEVLVSYAFKLVRKYKSKKHGS